MIISPEDAKKMSEYLGRLEIEDFLIRNKDVYVAGVECFGDEDKFRRWLLGKTLISLQICGGRVIDMEKERILDELNAISHGLFS